MNWKAVFRESIGNSSGEEVCVGWPQSRCPSWTKGSLTLAVPTRGWSALWPNSPRSLVHYGWRLGLGIQMQVTMEVLLTELGLSPQPLQESFVAYGKWVTNTWLKSIWEKVDKFNITVEIAPLPIRPPREGDKWFMQAVIEAGVTNADKLVKINRF
jgi:hypothetical protein